MPARGVTSSSECVSGPAVGLGLMSSAVDVFGTAAASVAFEVFSAEDDESTGVISAFLNPLMITLGLAGMTSEFSCTLQVSTFVDAILNFEPLTR